MPHIPHLKMGVNENGNRLHRHRLRRAMWLPVSVALGDEVALTCRLLRVDELASVTSAKERQARKPAPHLPLA